MPTSTCPTSIATRWLNPPDVRLNRTINLPLTAVRFLRTVDQYRSHFNIPPQNRSTGVVSLEFTETSSASDHHA